MALIPIIKKILFWICLFFKQEKNSEKKVVGLEDAIESYVPIFKLSDKEAEPDEESKSALAKLLNNRSFDNALKDYYREKNYVLLDSIYKLIISPKAHDALIVKRNIDMANSMDSIMKNNSLFAAVGAAHLGGKQGMLQLLEEKGYTVKPVISTLTNKGEELKEEFETNFPKPTLHNHSTKDGFISFKANELVYDDNNGLSSPDYTNGANLKISRVFLNNFLKEKDWITEKSIDSLFFENIPGKTLTKDFIETTTYKEYSISNVTKTGNHQHYNFYITPLEAISISLVGPKNYVALYENDYLNEIKLKSESANWVEFSPENNTFQITVPEYYVTHSDDDYRNTTLQAYNKTDDSYYFVIEKNLDDNYLENSHYEMQQIQREFLLQYKTEPTFTSNILKNVESKTNLKNGNTIYLNTKIIGSKYYLLGCVKASEENKTKFFNSFKIKNPAYNDEFKTFESESYNLSVKIPFKDNKQYFYNLEKNDYPSKNKFKQTNNNYTFLSETGKKVFLGYTKYHKYEYIENIDTLKNRFRRYIEKKSSSSSYDYDYSYDDYDYGYNNYPAYSILGYLHKQNGFKPSTWKKEIYDSNDDSPKTFEIINETETYNKEKDQYHLTYLSGTEGNTQAIRTEIIINNTEYIYTTALVDKNKPKEDFFINEVFSTINLKSSTERSVYDDKWQDFIDDAFSLNDSIRYSALNSLYYLTISNKDIPQTINFIERFNFKPNERDARNSLIEKMAITQHPDIVPFFEKYYKNESTTNETKLSILKSLTLQKNKKAYSKIFELMEYDLPVTNNNYEINTLFNYFNNDLENSKNLFPKIFEFYSVPEYNKPIVKFSSNIINKFPKEYKKLKPYRKMILTNAKLELKRLKNWEEQKLANQNDDDEQYEDYDYIPDSSVLPYLNLLFQDANQSSTTQFFNQVKSTKITSLEVELLRLKAINNELSNQDETYFLNNPKTAFLVMLLKNDTFNKTEEEIAQLALENFYNRNVNDSISLLTIKEVEHNHKKIKFFFYSIKEKEPKNYQDYLCSLAFVCDKNGKIDQYAYNYFGTEIYTNEDDLPEKYNKIINTNLNQNRPRVSFENLNSTQSVTPIYDYYGDY